MEVKLVQLKMMKKTTMTMMKTITEKRRITVQRATELHSRKKKKRKRSSQVLLTLRNC